LYSFFLRFFECIKEKPDIFHAHWSFPCGYIAYVASKIFQRKFIVTIHGGEIPLLKKFKFIKRLVVNALNKSVVVCANSNYTRDELVKLGVKINKIIIVKVPPNFVEHSSDQEYLNRFRSKLVDPSKKIVLFCGRLVERKGVEYLIRSMNDLKIENVHLIIVGDGILSNKLKMLTKSLGLQNKVSFYGRASYKELGLLHDISDIFVCPSIIDSKGITEYLGLVIPEAMESHIPVIATSVGGITDIVKNEINGLMVPPKDSASIAKAIERIISDKELRKKIVKNSEMTVSEFSTSTIANQYLEIFKSLVENSRK